MPPGEDADPGLYAPFRPRLARWVSLGLSVLCAVAGVVAALVLPQTGTYGASLPDQLGFLAVGLALAWFCWRQASVSARPDPDGVTVRNLLVTTRLSWADVVSVRFGEGRPWVGLDLADGDTLAVMGVQRADGERSVAEARRFATLVALHSRPPRAD